MQLSLHAADMWYSTSYSPVTARNTAGDGSRNCTGERKCVYVYVYVNADREFVYLFQYSEGLRVENVHISIFSGDHQTTDSIVLSMTLPEGAQGSDH